MKLTGSMNFNPDIFDKIHVTGKHLYDLLHENVKH